MIDALRVSGALPVECVVAFADPRTEPMLWLPDIIAGLIASHRIDWDTDQPRVELIEL